MKLSFRHAACKVGVSSMLAYFSLLACDSNPPVFTEKPAQDVFGENIENAGDASPEPGPGPGQELDSGQSSDPGRGKGSFDQKAALKAQWRFDATVLDRSDIYITAEDQLVSETFPLEQQVSESSVSYQQITRAYHSELFSQGGAQSSRQESFEQGEMSQEALDIVLVVDNSGSMEEEQKNLSTKLLPLLSYVSDSDWRIGVVTTDPQDGCLRALIDRDDPNPNSLFADAVMPGIGGSGNERGIYQAVEAMKGACQGRTPWLRSDSTLAVIFVTDEDNCSDGSQCGGAAWESADYLLSYLNDKRELGVNARVYGLLWHPDQSQAQCSTGYRQGNIYAQVITQSGGDWGSVCDSDYSSTLQSVSQDLSVLLKTQFSLSKSPLPGRIEVFVNGQPYSGYSVQGSLLVFAEPPPAGSQIDVHYDYQSEVAKSKFKLARPAIEDSLRVYIDDKEVGDFSYDPIHNQIVFKDAPAGDQVKVSYQENAALIKSFALEHGVIASSVQVFADKRVVEADQYSIDENGAFLTFWKAPKDGVRIEILFDRVIGERLTYPFHVPPHSVETLDVRDALSGESLPYELGLKTISFAPEDWQLDRKIELLYIDVKRKSDTLNLTHPVIADSITVSGSQSGPCQLSKVHIDARHLDFSGCGFSPYEAVQVNFDFISEQRQEFDLEGKELSWDKTFNITVWVNGEIEEGYAFKQGTLRFARTLPRFAKIRVEVRQEDKL